MSDYILAFDSGTQSVKTIIFDAEGNDKGEGRILHKVFTPKAGYAEQDPEEWWTAFCKSVQQALTNGNVSPNRIAAIGITHQRCTICVVDENGKPLLPAQVWYDSRAVKEVRWIKEKFGAEKYLRIAGRMPDTTWWAQKAMWIKNNEEKIFNKAYKLLTVHGYFVYKLTGNYKDSYAAPTGLLDMEKLSYSEELLNTLGIPREKLCDLVPPGEIIGYVSRKASIETGLPEGIPVASGAGDQQSGGLGCGVVRKGLAYLNLGTSVVLGLFSPEYVYHRNFLVREGAVPGTWNLEALVNSGYWLVTWFKDNFCQIEKHIADQCKVSIEELLEQEAKKVPAGSSGLIVQPYWLGVRQPYWDENAKGTIIGWRDVHTRSHFYRAIIEGIAYEVQLNIEGIEKALKTKIIELRAHGGGAKSPLSCQIIADVSNLPVYKIQTHEATALGAAILAAKAIRLYSDVSSAIESMVKISSKVMPIRNNHKIYSHIYKSIYRKLYPTLHPLMKKLNI
ncbi:MAG: FGGY-family carbohydrate kinase [Candidatus Bathyarchaeia archaeon]